MLSHPKVVAIGEIGLDYHYGTDDKEEQKVLFRKQLDLAVEMNMPVVIHERDCVKDCLDIIFEYDVRGVFHAFSGSIETYREIQKLGDWSIGIGGVLTFKKASITETVKDIPLERIVLETDSPYLTPAPHRGKRNESAYIPFIASRLAELKGTDPETVAAQTTQNAEKLFGI
jgi:TatD DNase family protein